MVWLVDPFDVFVLHVQGSAILQLSDDSRRGIHYAQSNGRTYQSIGAYLVKTGRMYRADVTMDSIRDYIRRHAQERDLILHQNNSFIFFHWSEAGPTVDNLGQPLTAGRSIAVDHRCYPPGGLADLDSRQPVFVDGVMIGWKRLQRFVSVQDTGSALVGSGRVDVFWGSDEQAGRAAERMKEDGSLFLLIPNEGEPEQRRTVARSELLLGVRQTSSRNRSQKSGKDLATQSAPTIITPGTRSPATAKLMAMRWSS